MTANVVNHLSSSSVLGRAQRKLRWRLAWGLVAIACLSLTTAELIHRDGNARSKAPAAAATAKDHARSVYATKQVAVSVAAISDATPDVAISDESALADVGDPASVSAGAALPGKPEENQSDAELADSRHEPMHVVAPVPTQNQGSAAINVQLASVKEEGPSLLPVAVISPGVLQNRSAIAEVRNAQAKSVQQLAVISNPAPRPPAYRTGDIGKQTIVASRVERVFVASAAFAVPLAESGQSELRSPATRPWSVTDEAALPDPLSLCAGLPAQDSLQVALHNWAINSRKTATPADAQLASDINRAIENSKAAWQILYEMGRVSAFMDRQSKQELFWRAAVRRVGLVGAGSTVTARDARILEVLAGTFLWVWENDELGEQALRVLLKSQRLGSHRLQQATLLFTDVLDRLSRDQKGQSTGN